MRIAPKLAAPPLAALVLFALAGAPPRAAAADLARAPKVAEAITLFSIWAEEQLAYHGRPGLAIAVVHRDGPVWSAGFGVADLETRVPMTPATPFRIGSVSKLFTATAILKLRDAGRLRLDDPVVEHLPWFVADAPPAVVRSITVEHLLTHTSGLPREGAFPYWTTHEFPTLDELRRALPGQRVDPAPGALYRYSNLGLALLGEIVAAASGRSWAAYVESEILAPLGMAESAAAPSPERVARLARAYTRRFPDGSRRIMEYYDTGAIAPAAAVVSTAEDLARFALFHLGGALEGAEGVLSAASRVEMQRPHFVYPSWNGGRGLGFALARRDATTFVTHGGWIGGHRADFLLDPELGVAVVALTNADDASPSLFSRKAHETIGRAVAAQAGPPAPPARPFDPAWERYFGVYTDPWGWEHQVLRLGDDLAIYGHGYPPDDDPDGAIVRLTPTATPHAFTMSDGEPLVFELDEEGRVERVRRRYEYLAPVER